MSFLDKSSCPSENRLNHFTLSKHAHVLAKLLSHCYRKSLITYLNITGPITVHSHSKWRRGPIESLLGYRAFGYFFRYFRN